MKSKSLLAAVLLAAPVLSRAADVTPPMGTTPTSTSPNKPVTNPIPAINAAIDQMMVVYGKTEDCFKTESVLRADLTQKKAKLAAEFKGKIPVVFDDLLWQKAARINRWHETCVQYYDELGQLFESLALSFRTVEPKNTNLKKQTEFVAAQKSRYLSMRTTAKPYNKPPKPVAPE